MQIKEIRGKKYKFTVQLYDDGTARYQVSETDKGGISIKTLSKEEYNNLFEKKSDTIEELSVDTAIEDLPEELFKELQDRFLKFAETNNIDIDNLEGGEFQNWYKDKKNKKTITGIINRFKKGQPKIKTKKKKLTKIEKLEEEIKKCLQTIKRVVRSI